MKRIILLSWLLTALINPELTSQSRTEIRNNFFEAESWMLFEDYREALPIYLRLHKLYPDNGNYMYRIGQCYLNMPGEKDKAVDFLEAAAKKIGPGYRDGRFRESEAPWDVLYHLANAYRINNEIDKAIETYKLFKTSLDPKIYDSTIINLQIQSCHNALKLMEDPVYVRKTNLGNIINSNNSEFNPVVSDDENLIVFSRGLAFYDAILYAIRTNGVWNPPVNMNEILKVDRDFFPTSLSADGNELYLYSSVDYDGNIYTSGYENGRWSLPVKLNDRINTKFWESHATVSRDNRKLYFTSNRNGGFGGLDIYVSEREKSGDWGPPVNLGPAINTPYNEETPFLSEDDKLLFFSSRGHFNMGGYDFFYAEVPEKGEWKTPVNMGFPLNTTDDDIFFKPFKNGNEGYIAKYSPGNFGRQDIYRVEIFSDRNPRKFFVIGLAKIADLVSGPSDPVKISVVDTRKNETLATLFSEQPTGEYELQLNQGVYEFTYETEAAEEVKRIIDLPVTYPADTVLIPATILPRTDFVAELAIEGNRYIIVTTSDPVTIRLRAETRSDLTVTHRAGFKEISAKKYRITDPSFSYTLVPLPGENSIMFTLKDRFSNTTSAEVIVSYRKVYAVAPDEKPEYVRTTSRDQIDAFINMLRNRADDRLRELIDGSELGGQSFARADDVLSHLKIVGAGKGIDGEDIDKLALRVALMDNVLTQAVVNLLARHAEGELKAILGGLDIIQANLKTWTDLQNYVFAMSEGRIKPEDLDRLADRILNPPQEPSSPAPQEIPDAKKKWDTLTTALVAGGGVLLLFLFLLLFLLRRRRKKKSSDQPGYDRV